MVETEKPHDKTKGRVRVACWITKVTKKEPDFIILTAFTR
jgi:hypothetical protein